MKADQASVGPVASATVIAGVSAIELASVLGITQPAAWDLISHPEEWSHSLSLRQLRQLSAHLNLATLSLFDKIQAASVTQQGSMQELADKVRTYCTRQQLSEEQVSEVAGWSVQSFLLAPEAALNGWCLDTLRDVCRTIGASWPDYLV